jgi:hypothetical protein
MRAEQIFAGRKSVQRAFKQCIYLGGCRRWRNN